jgi:hypothetical protein
MSATSALPKELLGRVEEIAIAQRNSPYPDQAYELEPYDNSPHIDNAKQEYEAIPSRVLSIYDHAQKKTTDFFNPKPVLDGIREEEKYGNNGDKFYFATKLVTSGLESVSNLLNRIVESPALALDKLSRGLTTTLDGVGAKIVGLAK